MYHLFNSQTARMHKKKGDDDDDVPGGKQKDSTRLVDVVPVNNNNDFWDENKRRTSLVRSLSRDSFSTITTTAEMSDSCFEISMSGIIEWEDGKPPAEIYIGQQPMLLVENFGLQRARVLPEPCLDDDEADNEEVEEYQRTICIGQQPILLGNFGLQRARVLPEPCLVDDDENDDEADNEEEEEYQKTFLPERMLPRQQNFRMHPSKPTFYDEDLKATAYW